MGPLGWGDRQRPQGAPETPHKEALDGGGVGHPAQLSTPLTHPNAAQVLLGVGRNDVCVQGHAYMHICVCTRVCGSAVSGSPPVSSAEPLLGSPTWAQPAPLPWPHGPWGSGGLARVLGHECPWGLATGPSAQPWRTRSLHALRAARPSCGHSPGRSPGPASLAVTLARRPQEPERLEDK